MIMKSVRKRALTIVGSPCFAGESKMYTCPTSGDFLTPYAPKSQGFSDHFEL